jgi:hypothetical protein
MNKPIGTALLAGLVIALVIMLPGFSAVGSPHRLSTPRVPLREGTSSNWAGYAVEQATETSTGLSRGKNNVVNEVAGTWIVPTLSNSNSTYSGTTYAATWIGIDGYSDSTVEQIGTEQDFTATGATTGNQVNYAWYEMYPHPMIKIDTAMRGDQSVPAVVVDGDTVSADVSYANGQFVLTLTNVTQNWTYTTGQTLNSAKRQSAEWIIEAPSAAGILPLANFGHNPGAQFTNCTFNGGQLISAGSPWAHDAITMDDLTTPAAQAVPTSLTNGTDFIAAWSTYTPPPPPHGHGHGR